MATIETNKAQDYTRQPKKITVGIGNRAELSYWQMKVFSASFRSRMASCGTTIDFDTTHLSKEDTHAVQAKATDFKPEAILSIFPASHVVETDTSRNGAFTSSRIIDIKYEISLTDSSVQMVEWKAEVHLNPRTRPADNGEAGKMLADTIIDRMQKDGLVSATCGTPASAPGDAK